MQLMTSAEWIAGIGDLSGTGFDMTKVIVEDDTRGRRIAYLLGISYGLKHDAVVGETLAVLPRAVWEIVEQEHR